MKNQVLSLTLADLNMHGNPRNTLVRYVLREPSIADKIGYEYTNYIEPSTFDHQYWATKITVQDIMQVIESNCPLTTRIHRYSSFKYFAKKITELGLTQLDWIYLPSSTVSKAELKTMSKKKVSTLPLITLGTMSHQALRKIGEHINKKATDVTIQDFLDISQHGFYYLKIPIGVAKTRHALLNLGFKKVGPLGENHAKNQLIKKLMELEGLDHPTATKVADLAEKHGWTAPLNK